MSEPWFFNVLPCHPRPYPDECLSGYLLRLAQANNASSLWSLIQDLFPTWPYPQRVTMLRWEYPIDDWGRLPLRTQLSPADLKALTVQPWVEKFRPLLTPRWPAFLSPGHFLHGVVNPQLQVCPLCLQSEPYVRLLWRLMPVTACLEHNCLLQTHCSQCGEPFTAIGPVQRHLLCAHCGQDMRHLPVIMASPEDLLTQQHRQAALRFLLDPSATLIKPSAQVPEAPRYLPQAIGRKFRYLRIQAGLSMSEIAQPINVLEEVVCALEGGRKTPFPVYLAYLDALSVSWPDFAALDVSPETELPSRQYRLLHLRLCPNPECPNHQPPPSTRVRISTDIPQRRVVRLHCSVCGKNFTRSYDGALRTRPCYAQPTPNLRHLKKLDDQVNRLVELGLQGVSNIQIAAQLGCCETTVHNYWLALGLEDQVHQAQTRRKKQEQQQRHAAFRARLETTLTNLIEQGGLITLDQVNRTLGYTGNCVGRFPDLAEYLQTTIQSHNARVRQHQYDTFLSQLMQVIEELKQQGHSLTVQGIVRQANLSYDQIRWHHPELLTILRCIVREHKAETKGLRFQCLSMRIDQAASRLAAQNKPLSCRAILTEAGLSDSTVRSDPAIQNLLHQWVGKPTGRQG
jgi:transcriptional regulator with XRE-family HTH domain